MLVVENKEQEKSSWILPQAQRQDGETLRQTAERALLQQVAGVTVKFLDNAPWGVHTIKYYQMLRKKIGVQGAKIVFFKAQLITGQVTQTSPNVQFNWLGRNELAQFVDASYLSSIKPFLIDEN